MKRPFSSRAAGLFRGTSVAVLLLARFTLCAQQPAGGARGEQMPLRRSSKCPRISPSTSRRRNRCRSATRRMSRVDSSAGNATRIPNQAIR